MMASSEAEQRKQQELIKNYRLRFHLRALMLCGVLPPEHVYSSPWKSRLYDLYTCFTLIWFLPAISSMLIELCNYLDSLEIAIPIIFQISAFVLSAILGMYFVYKRKIMMQLFYALETNFRPYMEKLGTSTKKLKTVEESLYTGKLISNMSLGAGCLTIFIWVVIPCVKGYIEFILQINQEDTECNHGKYFGLVMWFPSNVNMSPFYEIAQILHGITVFTGVFNITGWYMAMLGLMYHTATHFSMLVDLIEDTNIIFSAKEESEQKCLHASQGKEYIGKFHAEDVSRDGSQHLALQRAMLLHKYLMPCIKYHQEIIDLCKQIEDFLSPMLLIIFLFSEALMCLSTFRLAYGFADDESLKFLMSGSFFYVWLLAFCWAGEYLTGQSLAVERAVYSCPWYKHLHKMHDIKLIIMRAQKPIQLTAGKFYSLSLETYLQCEGMDWIQLAQKKFQWRDLANKVTLLRTPLQEGQHLYQIANTVYAYYTLLKNVADS